MGDFTAKVTEIKYITEDVVFMSLTRPQDFEFKAGQFITIAIKKGDIKRLKSYSIFSAPSKKESLDFCIKIIEEGFASEVFKETKVGDQFNCKGAFGRFFFDEESNKEECFFIGAGTGMTPLASMVREFLTKFPKKRFTLLLGYRYKKNILFDKEFKELAKNNPNFSYQVTLTREENWDGLKGRVQEHLKGELKNKKYYICGLKAMVIETREKLYAAGVEKEDVKFERYD
jgi:ferredoxin-NADP reductase